MAAAGGETPRVSIRIIIAAFDGADHFQSRLFGNKSGSVKHVRDRCSGNSGLARNVFDTHVLVKSAANLGRKFGPLTYRISESSKCVAYGSFPYSSKRNVVSSSAPFPTRIWAASAALLFSQP